MKKPRSSTSKKLISNFVEEEPDGFVNGKEQPINNNNSKTTKKVLKKELGNLHLKNNSATNNCNNRKTGKSAPSSAMSDDEIAEELQESDAGSDKENCVSEKAENSTLNKTNGHMICPDMDSKIDELIQNLSFSSERDSESDQNSFFDTMAEEGEEDTPSDDSNDIIEVGEVINTTESEVSTDDSYDRDSFIDDDGSHQLLSGEEYDLSFDDGKKKSRIIQLSSGSDVDVVPLEKIKKKKKKIKKKRKSRIIRLDISSDEEAQDLTNPNELGDVINTSCDLPAIDKNDDIVCEGNSSSNSPTLSSSPNSVKAEKNSNKKIVILENIKVNIPETELSAYASLINPSSDSPKSPGNEKFEKKTENTADTIDSPSTLVTKRRRKRKDKVKPTNSTLDSPKNGTTESSGNNSLVTEQNVINSSSGLARKTTRRNKSKKKIEPVDSPKKVTTEIVCNNTELVTQPSVISDSPGLLTQKKMRKKKSKKKIESVDNGPIDDTIESVCNDSELVRQQNVVSDSPGLVTQKKKRKKKKSKKKVKVDNELNSSTDHTTKSFCNNSELVTQQNAVDGSPRLVTENSKRESKKSKRKTANKRNCSLYSELKVEVEQTKSDEHCEDRKTSKSKKRKRRHSSESHPEGDGFPTKIQKSVVGTAKVNIVDEAISHHKERQLQFKSNLLDETREEIAGSKAEIERNVQDDKFNSQRFQAKDFKNAMLYNGTRIKRIKTCNFLQKKFKCRV